MGIAISVPVIIIAQTYERETTRDGSNSLAPTSSDERR
jgi:hypothetical protein